MRLVFTLLILIGVIPYISNAQINNGILLDADTSSIPSSQVAGKSSGIISDSTQEKHTEDTLTRSERRMIRRELRHEYRLKHPRTPWKAALMSGCLPGLGQMYNRKWWKVPIVWGGLGTIGYFAAINHMDYIDFRDAYRNRVNGIPTAYDGIYSDAALISQRDSYRRTRDMLFIIGSAVWLLNVVDATVDAHLSTFDVSKKLSLSINPDAGFMAHSQVGYFGLSFKIRFKNTASNK